VELDGVAYHPADQRGRDQARDNEAVATIGVTLRYGWAEVAATPCETAGQVYRALLKRGYQGGIRACSPGCRAVAAALPGRRQVAEEGDQAGEVGFLVVVHGQVAAVGAVQVAAAGQAARHLRHVRRVHGVVAGADDQSGHSDVLQVAEAVPVSE